MRLYINGVFVRRFNNRAEIEQHMRRIDPEYNLDYVVL